MLTNHRVASSSLDYGQSVTNKKSKVGKGSFNVNTQLCCIAAGGIANVHAIKKEKEPNPLSRHIIYEQNSIH